MPTTVVRRATTDDLEALANLARSTWVTAFGASVTEADVDAHLSSEVSFQSIGRWLVGDRVWIAGSETLAGYAHFGPSPFDEAAPGDQALHRLYVAPAQQGQGIGQQLLDAGLAEQEPNAATWLEVWTENPGAIRFYRRNGFEAVRERAFVSPTGIDGTPDLIMRRPPLHD